MSACVCGSKAAWKSHTFITLQEGDDIRVWATEKVGVVWVVTVTTGLVPKVEEKGVPNDCHMGRDVYIISVPESCENFVTTNGEIVRSNRMADTA